MINRLTWLVVVWFAAACSWAGTPAEYAAHITPLIHPAKLATLKDRGANPRVQKCVYWLAVAKSDHVEPKEVLQLALREVGMTNQSAADLTQAMLLRNLSIAGKLGALDEACLAEMRKGNAATVQRGPYKGDQLSVDHVIPRSVCVELDNVIANLELMPQRQNSSKNARVGRRQIDLARKLHRAGLLSLEGLRRVEKH